MTDQEIVLDHDPLSSRKHAAFQVASDGSTAHLVDLESRNGSAVNGQPVSDQALNDGDVIRIGDSFFILRWPSASPAEERPLRERREDILALIHAELGETAPPMSPDLAEALLIYPWPHDRAELLSVATELRIRGAGLDELVPSLVGGRLGERSQPTSGPADPTHLSIRKPMPSKADLEGLLAMHQGHIDPVAHELGRSRMQVYRWLKQYGLDGHVTDED